MKEINLKITGMSCQHCVMAVKMELKKLSLESFDVEIGKVRATYDESKSNLAKIENAIREAGYEIAK